MATTTDTLADQEQRRTARPRAGRGWWTVFVPSLSDLFFIAFIAWMFMAGGAGWEKLLLDGDTGWHIRTGDYILDTGAIPDRDLFSFTKPGGEWYAWEWLTDVIYALGHRALGLKGVVLLSGVLVAGFGTLLVCYLIWKGANTLAAAGVGLLVLSASSLHYLARPHLFTFAGLVCALWLLDRDRRRRTANVWLLVPMTALWANLHAGFVALFPFLGLLSVGTAIEALCSVPRPVRWWRPALRYCGVTAACGAASLMNPFGWGLHRHIAGFLTQRWVRDAVQEYQAPLFRHESELHFELLLFCGLLAAALLLSRRRFVEPLWVLFWAHFALMSWRHIPIFAIAASPVVACEATRLWKRLSRGRARRSAPVVLDELAADLAPSFLRSSVWPAMFVLALVLSPQSWGWPAGFPRAAFPVAMVERHAGLLPDARVFANPQWGDYLLYRFFPRQRVFADGRADFYGQQLWGEFIAAYTGRDHWEEILDRYGCDVALVPPDCPLAPLLRRHPGWELKDEDGQALLFVRRP